MTVSDNIQEAIHAYVRQPFGTFAELFRLQARRRPDHPALICREATTTYRELDTLADRIAAGLQRGGVRRGGVVAVCSAMSTAYVALFIGALRSGAAIALLSPSATATQLQAMLEDSGAAILFLDAAGAIAIGQGVVAPLVAIGEGVDAPPLGAWLPAEGACPEPVEIAPQDPFNIIYSSGTTGNPKGIVQPHAMRWPQLHLADPPGYGLDAVTLISTPLYSNTTLVSLLPALSGGGAVVLMPKFDARSFLELSELHRVTHAMLVPVQYRRILDVPDFERFDLSSYRMKFATSAPFSAELKAEVLALWPGGLIEYFGMTEGGGSCVLLAHERPDKLHTVGCPIEGHDMKIIDADGQILPAGQVGEVVGRSPSMMLGYHNQPAKSAEAEWFSPEGLRYIRTGDLARVDAEGFFTVVGRSKDVIISGGFNIYPVDLEAALLTIPSVREAAVVAAPSREWGETPIGFVTVKDGAGASPEDLKDAANAGLSRMQRLSAVHIVSELPRNTLGKVLRAKLQAQLSMPVASGRRLVAPSAPEI